MLRPPKQHFQTPLSLSLSLSLSHSLTLTLTTLHFRRLPLCSECSKMMKLSRLLRYRNKSEKLPFGKAGEVRDTLWLHTSTSRAGISSATQTFTAKGNFTDRIHAPYSIFKGKAALSVEPVAPKFAKSDSGIVRVDRRGVMMLCFWPSIGERKYDWGKRQMFALSATEVGSLISLGAQDSCEFFHDPSMLSSNAGQVRKSLSIKPTADGSGYFISLSVVNNILKTNERFTLPVTTSEFAVVKTACSFALPHIMGWDCLINQLPSGVVGNPSKVEPQRLDLEWDK